MFYSIYTTYASKPRNGRSCCWGICYRRGTATTTLWHVSAHVKKCTTVILHEKKTNPSIPTTSCRQSRTGKSSVLKKRVRLHRECGSRLMGLLSHSVNRQRGILSSIDFVLLQLIVCRCPFPGILNHLT